MHISHSTARNISTCQKKQEFKMAGHTEKTSENMFLGSAVHYGLELWMKGEDIDFAIQQAGEYIETFGNINKYNPDGPDKTIDDYELDSTIVELIEKAKEITIDTIDNPPEELVELINTCEIIGVEERIPVLIPIEFEDGDPEDGVNVETRIDIALADHDNKTLYIIDWKTSGVMTKSLSLSEKTQLTSYAMAYKSLPEYEDYKVYGCIVRILTKKRKADVYYPNLFLSFEITEPMINFVTENLVHNYLQLKLLKEGMNPTYGGLFATFGCSSCGYREMCDAYQAFKDEEEEE